MRGVRTQATSHALKKRVSLDEIQAKRKTPNESVLGVRDLQGVSCFVMDFAKITRFYMLSGGIIFILLLLLSVPFFCWLGCACGAGALPMGAASKSITGRI